MLRYSMIAAVTLLACVAFAEETSRIAAEKQTQIPEAGLWLPDQVIENIIDTAVDEAGSELSFDEDQIYLTQEAVKKHLMPLLNNNRAEIMELTNFLLESSFDDHPPTSEEAANWAKRAKPLLNKFVSCMDDIRTDLADHLTDRQALVIDHLNTTTKLGVDFFQMRLDRWADGGFDPETDWPKADGFSKAEWERQREFTKQHEDLDQKYHQRRQALKKDAATEAWERDVKVFIKKHELNEDQATKAISYLKIALNQRNDYLTKTTPKVEAARAKYFKNQTKENEAICLKALQNRAADIERIHTQLIEKLEKLLTPAQKKKAAEFNDKTKRPSKSKDAREQIRRI